MASIQLAQLLSRCTFWYSLFHSQDKDPGVKKKLLGFGALCFAIPAERGGLNFLQGVRPRPAVRGTGGRAGEISHSHRRRPWDCECWMQWMFSSERCWRITMRGIATRSATMRAPWRVDEAREARPAAESEGAEELTETSIALSGKRRLMLDSRQEYPGH